MNVIEIQLAKKEEELKNMEDPKAIKATKDFINRLKKMKELIRTVKIEYGI